MLLSALGLLALAQPRPHFVFNPTNPDVHDPVMAREDGKYYIFATGFRLASMSSSDLKTWEQGKPLMEEAPAWAIDSVPGYKGHTWAPDISFHNGLWHLYYSCSTFGKNTSAIGLMTNNTLNPESPDYKWVDQGVVVKSTPGITDWNAIDPNLIIDQAGTPWLTWGSFWDGIQLVQLAPDFKTPVGEPTTIARRYAEGSKTKNVSEQNAELAGNAPDAGFNSIEAPFMIYHDGYYYLFVSWDYCCRGPKSNYKTLVGRSKDVAGPFVDRTGKALTEGGGTIVAEGDDNYYGVGHSSAYDIDGQWYFLAHGYSVADKGASKLVLRKMSFDNEGWPVLD